MIPTDFSPLFWSYRVSDLDVKKNQRTIATQLINYGDLKHWRWLVQQYGRDGLREILGKIPETALRPRAARLVALMLGAERLTHASRSTH